MCANLSEKKIHINYIVICGCIVRQCSKIQGISIDFAKALYQWRYEILFLPHYVFPVCKNELNKARNKNRCSHEILSSVKQCLNESLSTSLL